MLQKVLVDKKSIFHKNPRFLIANVAVHDKTEIIIFRSPNFSDACIQ